MAKNKVKVDVEVTDNGTLKSVGSKSKAAGAGLDNLGKSANTADRNLKGAAQASSNSTKNFSKMAQGISGGLVPAYATLAANVFAITAAFQFFKQAGDLAILEESQRQYAYNTGRSMTLLTTQLQGAARGMLSYQDAAQGAAIGAAAGLSNAQLEGLADAAYRASVALGRDLTDSFNRLTRGAIKAEPELLDELGIIIRLDTVTKDYARTLGNVSANELTAFQRTQAVTNAILDQAAVKFDDLGENVNQVARLGKAFQDLLKDIQQLIQPITNFIGKALADNVTALAGAMALLGAPLLAALTPAAPAFTNIKESADGAISSLSRYADESTKVGKKLKGAKSFDDLTDKDLNYIESSQRATNSKIIKYDNQTRAAIVKNISIVRAQRKLLEAETKTGVKKMYAMWKAELALLQAQHGKTMGFLKAGMLGVSRVASKVLGAVGIIGLVITAIGMLKELLSMFDSPELKKFRDNVKLATEDMQAQIDAVKDIKENFKEAANNSERLHQAAQLLSNISFKNLDKVSALSNVIRREGITFFGLLEKGLGAGSIDKDVFEDQIESLNTLAGGSLSQISEQMDSLSRFNLEGTSLSKARADIEKYQKELDSIRLSLRGMGNDQDFMEEQAKRYSKVVAKLIESLRNVSSANDEATQTVLNQSAALKGLQQLDETFTKFSDRLKQPPGNFSSLIGIIDQANQALKTAEGDTIKNISDLNDKEKRSLEKILGSLEGVNTLEEARNALINKRARILEIEQKINLEKIRTERKFNRALSGATPLQAEKLNLMKQEKGINDEIRAIMAKHQMAAEGKVSLSKEQQAIDAERIISLQDQLALIREQNNLINQLSQAFYSGLEKGMQGQLASLIKGEESSFTDAVKNMAKQALTGIADVLAKSLTQDLMSIIPGYETPEQKIQNAMMIAADYHAQKIIQAMQTGSTTTGLVVPSDSSAESTTTGQAIANAKSNPLGFFSKAKNYLFGTTKGSAKTTDLVGATGNTIANPENSAIQTGVFSQFTSDLKSLFDGDAPFLSGLAKVFSSGLQGFDTILGDLARGLFGNEGLFASETGFFSSLFSAAAGARYGGVLEGYSTGGIARGSQAGYPAILHGTEAVVPLPHGNAIPVEMRGAGNGTNNVVVNVNVDNQGNATTTTESQSSQDAGKLGQMISQAVQKELQNQKRSGGILNPYGAS